MDVRPIRLEEADSFLRVLCSVFGLDHSRAKDVFYQEPLFDLNRKWAAFENREIVCTLTTVPLLFGDGPAMGIAGVATQPSNRGRGFATRLLDEVLKQSSAKGEPRALLFANCENLYKRCGFRTLDTVVSQPLVLNERESQLEFLGKDQIRPIYDAWSSEHPARLRRDERRWNYWAYNPKTAYRTDSGYVCYEFGRVREMLVSYCPLALNDQAEWYGLKSLAEQLHLPMPDPKHEMFLMGKDFDTVPQMFLTDQF